jgi:hypothetical protein
VTDAVSQAVLSTLTRLQDAFKKMAEALGTFHRKVDYFEREMATSMQYAAPVPEIWIPIVVYVLGRIAQLRTFCNYVGF